MPFLKTRTYLNADRTKVVDEDSPDAAFLLGNEGTEITDDEAKQYKLKTSDEPAPSAPQPSAGDSETEADAEAPAEPKATRKAR